MELTAVIAYPYFSDDSSAFPQILFFSVIVYFMSGFQASAGKFFIFFLVLALFALTSETIGHLCAIVTKTSHNGAASFSFFPPLLLLLLLLL